MEILKEELSKDAVLVILSEAIRLKRVVRFKYEDGKVRVGEPYLIYKSKAGDLMTHVIQTEGYSSSGKMGWKMYNLKEIKSIEILDKEFEVSKQFNPLSKMYKNIQSIVN